MPNDEDMRQTVNSIERSERKFKPWRDETEFFNGLYVNDFYTYNEASPGGEIGGIGRGVTTTVVRNGVYFSVNAAIRRKQIKNPVFEAEPQISMIQLDGPDGQPVEVESSYAAYAQGECATYMARTMKLSDQMIPVLEENEIGNEAWLKIVSWDGADAPETMAWVIDPSGDGEDDQTSNRKLKARRPVNSLANARFPGAIFVSNADVICDADAVMASEFTRITHRIVKPLSQMKTAEVTDYGFEQDQRTGNYKYVPVMETDPETGEQKPKRRKKYMNLDGLVGNYEFYIEKRLAGMKQDKKGDIRNAVMGLTEHDPKDYLVFFEESFKVPADSGMVESHFGFVPKTIDGFCYGWKTYVEQTGANKDEAPTLIRFDFYPVDLGGFCLKRLQGRPKANSQKGFSWIRNAFEAQALENYWDSYDTDWYSAVKPVNVWDRNKVDPALINSVTQTGEHLSNVLADIPAGGSLRDVMFTTQFQDSPQGVSVMKMRMRSIQDEASGASANQRLQSSGDVSATQSSLISQSADDQTAFDIEIVKAFVEDVVLAQMRVFIASLPPSGRFEIPGSDGAFVLFDRMQLDLSCVYRLTYTSFNQAPNPVQNKQLGELTNKIINTPPQLWEKMMPFWEIEAAQFTPAVMSAFRKFQKGLGDKPDTDPMKEHVLMGVGIAVEPDPNENFIETVPKHKKMLQEVTSNPMFAQWNEPVKSKNPKQNGQVPRTLLAIHYKKSCNLAIAKGLGPALGLQPDQAGSQSKGGPGNARGSAQDSGRTTQQPPESGAVEAGANSVEMTSA